LRLRELRYLEDRIVLVDDLPEVKVAHLEAWTITHHGAGAEVTRHIL
jgi:hypothetical protein